MAVLMNMPMTIVVRRIMNASGDGCYVILVVMMVVMWLWNGEDDIGCDGDWWWLCDVILAMKDGDGCDGDVVVGMVIVVMWWWW